MENRLVVIVTYYDKGYNITGTEKIIHRYLPQEVGELLLLYIWLVLPMQQQLQLLVFNDTEIPSAFLWSMDQHKKWTAERMRKLMNLATVSCLEDQEACDNCRCSYQTREELFEQNQQAEVKVEVEVEAEVEEDDDMVMTAVAADLQEYQEQQEQRQDQQNRYRQSRMAAAVKVFDLEQTLFQLRGRCLYCHYYGMEDEHEFSGCGEGQEDYNILLKVKRAIRYG